MLGLLFLSLFAPGVHAQAPVADAPPEVSLVTFEPGEVYWQRFAHDALLLRTADGQSLVFNYGIFDFGQKNFFLNFARGRMRYRLDVEPLQWTLGLYASEHRWAYEQRLDLSVQQRRQLADYLVENLRPENVEYSYDYFANNCSTRVRDAIDTVLGGALRSSLEAQPAATTYRDEALRMMSPDWSLMVGMHLGLGPRVDVALNRWQQSFLPITLMRAVRDVRITAGDGSTHPLVSSEGWLLPPSGAPYWGPVLPLGTSATDALFVPFAFAGGAFAALVLLLRALRRWATLRALSALLGVAFCLVAGLVGVILAAAWGLSDHWGMWGNHNLLLFNPLLLLLIPAWTGAARGSWYPGLGSSLLAQAAAVLAIAAAALSALPVNLQDNQAWIALMLPAHLALAWTLRTAHRSPPIWSR